MWNDPMNVLNIKKYIYSATHLPLTCGQCIIFICFNHEYIYLLKYAGLSRFLTYSEIDLYELEKEERHSLHSMTPSHDIFNTCRKGSCIWTVICLGVSFPQKRGMSKRACQ